MRALVVFESMFGNTRDVATAIAQGLADEGLITKVVEVATAPSHLDETMELLVVGAPTHAFGLSRPETRSSAAEKAHAPLVSRGTGVREWLEKLHRGAGVQVAAFDTRVDKPRVPGSAARKVDKRLRRLGFRTALPAQSFYVKDTEGPLVDGELELARAWGARLATSVQSERQQPRRSA